MYKFRMMIFACVQVEFNKAAQSWTDSQLPSAQKKTALNRLFKVLDAYFLSGFCAQILCIVCWCNDAHVSFFMLIG
jgi:hypothetical protein